ncbi:MAG: hypothetical protein LKG42_06695 [Eubacterium sp.]|jgi:hypothetical protein|nr:hypothetical protein [Eubacterium sp.]MCH4046207.1 hypothetical protein [Eubacterium sp.]MCH4079302.1 hypothetical protein [Eubacterium sp.]MCH4110526.1 hypothetical protein [Eubacterium sp.]MCI1307690.1 hypothetical protein [Eubacterium sp.]
MSYKHKRIRSIIGLCILAALAAALIVNMFVSSGKNSRDQADRSRSASAASMKSWVICQKQGMDLRDKLGYESAYTYMYTYAQEQEKLFGKGHKTAWAKAQTTMLSQRALLSYAKSQGIRWTKSDINAYIKRQIASGRKAKSYNKINKACRTAGIKFSDSYWKCRESYTFDYVTDKLYKQEQKGFQKKKKGGNWNKQWKKIQDTALQEYKARSEYAQEAKLYQEGKKIYLSKDRRNVAVIKERIGSFSGDKLDGETGCIHQKNNE